MDTSPEYIKKVFGLAMYLLQLGLYVTSSTLYLMGDKLSAIYSLLVAFGISKAIGQMEENGWLE